jgi:hypothetical protein
MAKPMKVRSWGGISLSYKSTLMKMEGHTDPYKCKQMLGDSGVFTNINALARRSMELRSTGIDT